MLALQKKGLQIVGAVDTAPPLRGQDFGTVLGLNKPLNVPVSSTLAEALSRAKADVVIHCTGSKFDAVFGQFEEIAHARLHCVTSCEEALFPYRRYGALAKRLDDLCRQCGVAVVGTGVNPGFVMDTLPLVLSFACQKVESVRVRRVVDASTRREALQRKVGATMSVEQFRSLVAAGKMGHVGLVESLLFVADGLGWTLDDVSETIEPVVADRMIQTKFLAVNPGEVAGVHQVASGKIGGRELIALDLQMYVGAREPMDEIVMDGEPPVRLTVPGGTPGDVATPAALVNTVARVMECAPGLHTMRTVGFPRIME